MTQFTFHQNSERDFHIRCCTVLMRDDENDSMKKVNGMNGQNMNDGVIKLLIEAYPRVEPMMSSAWDEIISAIISSFIASFALRHFLPPGKTIGRSWAWRPRKLLAFFCFMFRSSVTFCRSSADNSLLASFGSGYSFEMWVRRWMSGIEDGRDKIYARL